MASSGRCSDPLGSFSHGVCVTRSGLSTPRQKQCHCPLHRQWPREAWPRPQLSPGTAGAQRGLGPRRPSLTPVPIDVKGWSLGTGEGADSRIPERGPTEGRQGEGQSAMSSLGRCPREMPGGRDWGHFFGENTQMPFEGHSWASWSSASAPLSCTGWARGPQAHPV